MYLSTIGRRDNGGTMSRGKLAALGTNVFALGAVSLVTDISSEMVTAILPIYLVLGLHLSPAAYGVFDGLYTGATALLRLVGGYVSDRVSRRKTVAGVGYALSAVAKLGLVAAGASAPAIGAVITADRTGKGLRTAPRDALITLSAPESMLGRAFGVHRALFARVDGDTWEAWCGHDASLGVDGRLSRRRRGGLAVRSGERPQRSSGQQRHEDEDHAEARGMDRRLQCTHAPSDRHPSAVLEPERRQTEGQCA